MRAFEFFGGVVKILDPNFKDRDHQTQLLRTGCEPGIPGDGRALSGGGTTSPDKKAADKGAGENGVQNVERWVIAPLRNRKFFSLHEVNLAIKEKLEQLNNKMMQSVRRACRQEFEEIDQPNLRPLPEKPYEYAERKTATVNIDYHIEFDEHLYSVPYT